MGPVTFSLTRLASDFGVGLSTLHSWTSGDVLPIPRDEDGRFLISPRTAASLCLALAVGRGSRPGAAVQRIYRITLGALDAAAERNGTAWLVVDLATGWNTSLATMDPRPPVPEKPSHQVVNLSEIERRWTDAFERAAEDGELDHLLLKRESILAAAIGQDWQPPPPRQVVERPERRLPRAAPGDGEIPTFSSHEEIDEFTEQAARELRELVAEREQELKNPPPAAAESADPEAS